MTDVEDAIQAMENLNMVLSITDSERYAANLAIQALKEKAEWEKCRSVSILHGLMRSLKATQKTGSFGKCSTTR